MAKPAADTNGEKTGSALTAPPTESEGITAEKMRRVTGTSDPTLQQKLVIEALGGAGLLRPGLVNEEQMAVAMQAFTLPRRLVRQAWDQPPVRVFRRAPSMARGGCTEPNP